MNIRDLFENVNKGYSLLRAYENKLLEGIEISGEGVDLGAKSKDAKYYEYINTSKVKSVEFVDYFHSGDGVIPMDLEKPFPINEESYDFVLLFNVMEHIYNYNSMLREIHRILKAGGELHGVVPFMWQYHPDPGDYFRFTGQALEKILSEAGYSKVDVKPLGSGPFKVAMAQVGVFVRFKFLRFSLYLSGEILDNLLGRYSNRVERFSLGYYFYAKKL